MRSRITIDFCFNSNQPVIEINFQKSDDVRDKLLQTFLHRLGGDSAWFRILDNTSHEQGQCRMTLGAIRPEDLVKEYRLMQDMVSPDYAHTPERKTEQWVDPMTIRCGPTPIDNRSDRS